VNLQLILAVGTGGFLGAISRMLLSTFVQKLTGASFPYGTLAVNVVGSFIIGFLYLYFEQSVSPVAKGLLITGFLGALTTFSTFSLESFLMIANGLFVKAMANISVNVILCLIATMSGMALFRKVYGI